MGYKKILSIVFQFPAWILLFGGFIVSIYAYLNKIQDLSIATPIILLIINILYVVGRLFIKEDNYQDIDYQNTEKYNKNNEGEE